MIVTPEELNNTDLFVFKEILVFESVFYKIISIIPLLFEIVLHLHQFQIKGDLILHTIIIGGTSMIEAGIDGL